MALCTDCNLPRELYEIVECSLLKLQEGASGSCVRCSFVLSFVEAFTTRNSVDVRYLERRIGDRSEFALILTNGGILDLEVFIEHGMVIRSNILQS